MTRSGVTLIETLFGIIIVWFVVWLTSYITDTLKIHLFFASAVVVYSYLFIIQLVRWIISSKKSTSRDDEETLK
jgi:prolipoprotein diacylglyceryltransferase